VDSWRFQLCRLAAPFVLMQDLHFLMFRHWDQDGFTMESLAPFLFSPAAKSGKEMGNDRRNVAGSIIGPKLRQLGAKGPRSARRIYHVGGLCFWCYRAAGALPTCRSVRGQE
jgi:hypothetical protein